MVRIADLPPPPDPLGIMDRYGELAESFLAAAWRGDDWEVVEEAFLSLYAHLHGHEAPYSSSEREVVRRTGGYWNHAGGLAPVLKAGPWIRPDTVSMDLGAGNGLQLLLVQALHPHRLTVQVEVSRRMVEAGEALQRWLSIRPGRVRWRVADVRDAHVRDVDFLYLYRPVRPEGQGEALYRRLARELCERDREVVVFSVADCLRSFVTCDHELLSHDGHLTCLRFPSQ
jgi:hypothetical protein